MTTVADPPPRKPGQPKAPPPRGYAIDPQKLLDEIVRLEGRVAELTTQRDTARDLAARSGYFINTKDEIRP